MKRLMMNESLCLGCHNCEGACEKAYHTSCIRIDDNPDGSNTIHVCNQCGKCAEVCNGCVIRPNSHGVYMLDHKECAGCLMCVGYCPEGVMVYSDDRAVPHKCTACGLCVQACPTGAIWIEED